MEEAQAAGIEDTTSYGNVLVDTLIGKVADKLTELLALRMEGKAGRKGAAFNRLQGFCGDFSAPAFISLRMVIATLSKPDTGVSSLASRIGRMIEDELDFRLIKDDDDDLYTRLKATADKRASFEQRRHAVKINIAKNNREKPEASRWTEREHALVGATMIECIVLTGLVERVWVSTGKNDTENRPLPPKPFDIEENEVTRKEWRTAAHRVYMENRETEGRRIAFTDPPPASPGSS